MKINSIIITGKNQTIHMMNELSDEDVAIANGFFKFSFTSTWQDEPEFAWFKNEADFLELLKEWDIENPEYKYRPVLAKPLTPEQNVVK